MTLGISSTWELLLQMLTEILLSAEGAHMMSEALIMLET